MKKTRQIHPRTTHTIIIVVIIAYLIGFFSLYALLAQSKKEADNAAQLAAYYQEQTATLAEENYLLRHVLSSYQQNDFLAGNPTPPRYFDVALSEDLQSYIWVLCCNYGIEEHYELVYAIIKQESQFNAAAISASNDWGLMQINACNHEWLSKELGIVDFLDPYENVHGGIHIIASLLHKYDVPDALMAYNMGEGNAAKLWRRGIHSTTYTDRVLDYYMQFIENI